MTHYSTQLDNWDLVWSPHNPSLLAVASSENHGLGGVGRLSILTFINDSISCLQYWETPDNLYSCDWSRANPSVLVGGLADSSVQLFQIPSMKTSPPLSSSANSSKPQEKKSILSFFTEDYFASSSDDEMDDNAVLILNGHSQAVQSVKWNPNHPSNFLSCSWDGDVRLWDPSSQESISVYRAHTACCYQVAWDPHKSTSFVSVGRDQVIHMWSSLQKRPVLSIPNAHPHQILCADFSPFQEHLFATGGADCMIRIWDLRNTQTPTHSLFTGHQWAVRSLKFCPHENYLLASASYDSTVCFWDVYAHEDDSQLGVSTHHHDFVCGIDWHPTQRGKLASCAWDKHVSVWTYPEECPPIPESLDHVSGAEAILSGFSGFLPSEIDTMDDMITPEQEEQFMDGFGLFFEDGRDSDTLNSDIKDPMSFISGSSSGSDLGSDYQEIHLQKGQKQKTSLFNAFSDSESDDDVDDIQDIHDISHQNHPTQHPKTIFSSPFSFSDSDSD